MFYKLRLVHSQRRVLYKNFVLFQQSLTLPSVSFCRPYIAYIGTESATVMIAADGKISNHILTVTLNLLCYFAIKKNTAKCQRNRQLLCLSAYRYIDRHNE